MDPWPTHACMGGGQDLARARFCLIFQWNSTKFGMNIGIGMSDTVRMFPDPTSPRKVTAGVKLGQILKIAKTLIFSRFFDGFQ